MLHEEDDNTNQDPINEKSIEINTLSIFSLNTINVYRQIEGYAISIYDLNADTNLFYFDENFNFVTGTGRKPLTLLDYENTSLESIKTINEMKRLLGQPFTDVGSGLYIPAYLTDNGRILCFCCENEYVVKLTSINLYEETIRGMAKE